MGLTPTTSTNQKSLYFTSGAPAFAALIDSLQGNAGDPSDGFEAAAALVSGALPAIESAMTQSDTMIALVSALADDLGNTPDTLDASLAALDSLYAQMESDLGLAIDALQTIGGPPAAFQIPGIPGLPNLVAPAVVDISALLGTVLGEAEAEITGALGQVWDTLEMVEEEVEMMGFMFGTQGYPSWF